MDDILTPCPIYEGFSKIGTKRIGCNHAKIVCYFYEKGIALNKAASSSFALIIEESLKFAR